MEKTEIEVKLELTSKEYVIHTNAFAAPYVFERVYGFFKPDFSNIEAGVFPRIKYMRDSDGNENVVLTVKVKKAGRNKYFIREETEIDCKPGHLDSLRRIIRALGFSTELVFEKYRKTFTKRLVYSFDILPFGYFIGLEGDPKTIEKSIKKLGYQLKPRITVPYLELWDRYCQKNGITNPNCTFSKNTKFAPFDSAYEALKKRDLNRHNPTPYCVHDKVIIHSTGP